MSDRESSVIKQLPDGSLRMVPISGNTVTTPALLAERSVLTILHNNEPYQLRITRKNKLILTK